MAFVAVHNALSRSARLRPQRLDPTPIPWVTFTAPEVGRVGMTEAQAAGHRGRVAYLPLTAVDRAVTAAQTEGFVKLIAGPRRGLGNAGGRQILGGTVVAPTRGELIQCWGCSGYAEALRLLKHSLRLLAHRQPIDLAALRLERWAADLLQGMNGAGRNLREI